MRPDFSAVTLPPVTTVTPAGAGAMRNNPSPLRPDNKKPSFKGEYEPRPIFGEESRLSSGNSTDAQESRLKSGHASETPMPRIKSEYDSEPQGASFRSGYESETSFSTLRQDADPLSVLACAGRMVDREEKRGRTMRNERREHGHHQGRRWC